MPSAFSTYRGLAALPLVALCVFAAACEETAAPPPQGAFNVRLSDTGAQCPLASHANALGDASKNPPDLVTDGTGTSTVECVLEAVSGGFAVSATLRGKASLSLEIESISNKQSADTPATGLVSYASTETGGDTFSSLPETPCEFWVDGDLGQYVEASKAWISFRCSSIQNQQDTCSFDGTFALANCEQPEAEEE